MTTSKILESSKINKNQSKGDKIMSKKFIEYTPEEIMIMEKEVLEILSKGPLTSRSFKDDVSWVKEDGDLIVLSQLLQKMKRDKKIRSEGKTWYSMSVVPCTVCGGKGWIPA